MWLLIGSSIVSGITSLVGTPFIEECFLLVVRELLKIVIIKSDGVVTLHLLSIFQDDGLRVGVAVLPHLAFILTVLVFMILLLAVVCLTRRAFLSLVSQASGCF